MGEKLLGTGQLSDDVAATQKLLPDVNLSGGIAAAFLVFPPLISAAR